MAQEIHYVNSEVHEPLLFFTDSIIQKYIFQAQDRIVQNNFENLKYILIETANWQVTIEALTFWQVKLVLNSNLLYIFAVSSVAFQEAA